MGIGDFFKNMFPIFNRETGKLEIDDDLFKLSAETYYKNLALQTGVNLIADTLSLADFKTFENGKDKRGTDYYRLNIEPNPKQNASRFWKDVVYNLVYNNEALIIRRNDFLYLCDSFVMRENGILRNTYYDVVVDGMKLKEGFTEKDVIFLKLHNKSIRGLIESVYQDYGKLIEYSKNTYKRSNARRGTLEIPTNYPQTPKAQDSLNALLNERFKGFSNAENGAILPLTNGLKYTDLTNQTYKNGSDSRDIRFLIDDVFDYVAIALNIPPQLLKGSVADSDKSFNNFMTFCIRPIARLIEDEINRKMYGKDEVEDGFFVKMDISMIERIGLKDMALAIDILTRNGVNTLDDNLSLLGRQELKNKIGKQRFMTLNLNGIENILKGGEMNE